MNKALYVAWKDIQIRVADRAAFIFLLLTPLVLTLILGAAFGGLGGTDSGLSAIPVSLVNLDSGDLGQALAEVLTSDELSDLLVVSIQPGEASARALVDQENYAAAVIIPVDFTARAMPAESGLAQGMAMLSGGLQPEPVNATIYVNPTRSINANIVRSIVEAFGWQVSGGIVGGMVSVEQLLASGKLGPSQIMSYVEGMSERLQTDAESQAGDTTSSGQLVTLRQQSRAGEQAGSDTDWVIAYYAPSMAIMFLSFGVTQGARTILEEKRAGTLDRLLTTPTASGSILGGKLVSTFVIGLIQFAVLVGVSSLLFRLDWGEPLAVILLSLALVAAMTSLGVVLAAVVRSEEQVNTWGVAVLLVFSAVSGNFVPRFGFPQWLKTAGLFTPNAWALEAFTKLGTGAGLGDIAGEIAALSAMAAVLFAVGVIRFRQRMTG